ncbi:MAG: hypothetical protein MJ106_02675 [Lentisphaeria bacterium]|nr:hypothetical protein [Lentisphaeria bacterium]
MEMNAPDKNYDIEQKTIIKENHHRALEFAKRHSINAYYIMKNPQFSHYSAFNFRGEDNNAQKKDFSRQCGQSSYPAALFSSSRRFVAGGDGEEA